MGRNNELKSSSAHQLISSSANGVRYTVSDFRTRVVLQISAEFEGFFVYAHRFVILDYFLSGVGKGKVDER